MFFNEKLSFDQQIIWFIKKVVDQKYYKSETLWVHTNLDIDTVLSQPLINTSELPVSGLTIYTFKAETTIFDCEKWQRKKF